MKTARLTHACGALAVLLLSSVVASASDILSFAANGSLWDKPTGEVSKQLFSSKGRYTRVDNVHIRVLKGAGLTVGNVKLGDVTMELTEDGKHFVALNTTIFNKGDDGDIEKEIFEARLKQSVQSINNVMGVEGKTRQQSRKETGLKTRAWEWENEHCAVLLEAASTGKGKKYTAEFIRMSVAPTKGDLEKGGANDSARRSDLKGNVVHEENGDVWIKGVPMVDQGEKGYCVPAAVSRVFAYCGMDGVDQHALAALCKSSDQGTSIEDMEKALKSICGPFHMTIKSWDWVGIKSFIKKARKMVKKTGTLPDDREIAQMILEDVGKHPGTMNKGLNGIKQQVNAGIPVVWAVVLGIFPEQGLPQSFGGHMRLIIGYNEQEKRIIYTDTWGMRHAKKAMSMSKACAITHRLWVLRPAM